MLLYGVVVVRRQKSNVAQKRRLCCYTSNESARRPVTIQKKRSLMNAAYPPTTKKISKCFQSPQKKCHIHRQHLIIAVYPYPATPCTRCVEKGAESRTRTTHLRPQLYLWQSHVMISLFNSLNR